MFYFPEHAKEGMEQLAEQVKADYEDDGMTLRDYFAAQMGAAIIKRRGAYKLEPEKTAEEAYRLADAMLKARAA